MPIVLNCGRLTVKITRMGDEQIQFYFGKTKLCVCVLLMEENIRWMSFDVLPIAIVKTRNGQIFFVHYTWHTLDVLL